MDREQTCYWGAGLRAAVQSQTQRVLAGSLERTVGGLRLISSELETHTGGSVRDVTPIPVAA